ncbi:hypothetical protein SETIT_2G265200v2 [Setaria italica]|uniref:Nucleotide-diphospho-sugar transferase domain-containing protein n=2 Tax=Setaria TaxID=4554 RepID=K4A0W3_SETIT|nr:uncharacterized protein At4g15970 [Setaria italica]XP_034583124.1 uncharacterized protein At4g15970-like [Setaria viridis]RCV12383.1 hypothetical protein SETIT_2G265200v2 [Setaria italica]TKW33994.1 hypothetical protein SEVIR_2G275800v2 [Setaria viridis]
MNTVANLLRFLLVAAIGTVACVVLLQQRSPFPCGGHVDVPPAATTSRNNGTRADDDPTTEDDGDKLPEVLRRAAMEDKTIIMTFTNEAWTAPGSLTDLFLESFRTGVRTAPLLRHLVIVAIDAKAFERCQHVHPLCYALPVNQSAAAVNYASEQRYMARDYLDMLWRRNRFQARVLELGYSFVFTDVDIVWFRNPLLRIPVAADMAFSCDWYSGSNPYDLNKRANGGFLYVRASARTAALYGGWYESRAAYPGQHEQFVFDKVKRELSARHGVTVQFVDTAYLGTFCDRGKRKDWHKLCTFHANCVIGLKAKLEKLRGVLDEWQRFKAKAGPNGTALTD